MKNIELLSPAGNFEAFKFAIDAGADAVYIGGEKFSARAFSNNFSIEEIEEAVKYAHLRNVQVYVAVNTLILTSEFEECIQFIDELYKVNVDAIIVQDYGLLNYAINRYPNMEVHASTQMTIDSLEGVLHLESLGVDRVVLAREMHIEEIKEIRKHTSIPLEIFVSGALCVSYSGQCLMSSLIGGRSGNRGTCSQNCRKRYDYLGEGNPEYKLSSKDLFVLDELDEVMELGNVSLKIEGRMKRSEYVKKVTSMFRNKIDSVEVTEEDKKELKSLFNREFTKGHLFDDFDVNPFRPNHLGIPLGTVTKDFFIQLDDDLHQGDGIRVMSDEEFGLIVNRMEVDGLLVSQAKKGETVKIISKYHPRKGDKVVKTTDTLLMDKLQKESYYKKYPVYFEVSYCGDSLEINVFDDDGTYVYNSASILEESDKNHSERILTQISKSGDYPFEIETMGDIIGVYAKTSDLNKLRRDTVELYMAEKLKRDRVINEVVLESIDVNTTEDTIITILNESQIIDGYDIYSKKLDYVNMIQPRVGNKNLNTKKGIVSNISGLHTFEEFSTNFSLNVTNPYTVYYLHKLGAQKVCLSVELNKHQIIELEKAYIELFGHKPNLELIVYGKLEAMIIKHKLKDGVLVDTHGAEYNVTVEDLTTIYHSKTLDLISRLDEVPKMNYRLDFTFESKEEVLEVLERFKREESFHDYYGHFDLGI